MTTDFSNKTAETLWGILSSSGLSEESLLCLPHEFNTPLNGVIGGASILLEMAEENEVIDANIVREHAKIVLRSGNRLNRVLGNFAFFHQLQQFCQEAEREEIVKNSRCLSDSVRSGVEGLVKRYERGEDVCVYFEPAEIQINELYWKKLVDELVDNALKFSIPQNPIDVLGRIEGTHYQLSIMDKGRGMSKGEVGSIAPFKQFEREKYEQQGLGLGLTIARTIAEVHDGKLLIDSNQGVGTMVSVSIPIVFSEFLE